MPFIIGVILTSSTLIGSFYLIRMFVRYLPKRRYNKQLTGIVKSHYASCSGTRQYQGLIRSHKYLCQKIVQINDSIQNLNKEVESIEQEKNKEIEKIISNWVLYTHLTDVSGINTRMRDNIIAVCFNGTLKNVWHTVDHVRGIGPHKARAIRYWLNGWMQQLPDLLRQDFEGRDEIINKYKSRQDKIKKQIHELDLQRRYLSQLSDDSKAALENFKTATIEHFLGCFSEDNPEVGKVTSYIQGLYPEWEDPPTWYKTITTKF